MIICIGPKSSGKTLLLRRLQQSSSEIHCEPFHEIFSTVPTVGVNIAHLKFTKNKLLDVSELGGAMAPIWPMHYSGCEGVIFVIDAANLQQVSCACMQLYEALKHDFLQNTKFMIVFNKTDVNMTVKVNDVKFMMRMHDVCDTAKQDVEVVESSCVTGRGVKDIKNWLLQFAK